jgi:membrane-bound lytic murein transglycosylase D
LPTPAGLADDVHFWEAVFAKYSPDQCIFHDRDDLTMIYAVKRLPGVTPRQQAAAAKHYLGILREAISHLAAGGEVANRLERRIYQITPERQRTPAFWREAAANVRCQRGVDLKPSLARSKVHLRMVKRILQAEGLPTDLAYLPHLESGYDVRARSRAGALGLWQLMPATARLAGLKAGRGGDTRTDPYRSTLAAAGMLKGFYARTGSWPLAITAYNYGINGTVRAIKQWGTDYMTVHENHRTSVFGFAARNYYPSFLAVRNVSSGFESSDVAMGGGRRDHGL